MWRDEDDKGANLTGRVRAWTYSHMKLQRAHLAPSSYVTADVLPLLLEACFAACHCLCAAGSFSLSLLTCHRCCWQPVAAGSLLHATDSVPWVPSACPMLLEA